MSKYLSSSECDFELFAEAEEHGDRVGSYESEMLHQILVVEDDPLVAQVIDDVLSEIGVSVFTARDALEALAVFREQSEATSCIILDYGIPGMHASRLVSKVRELKPGVKVLVSSGYPLSLISKDLPSSAFDGFIPKPYSPQFLLAELKKLMLQ